MLYFGRYFLKVHESRQGRLEVIAPADGQAPPSGRWQSAARRLELLQPQHLRFVDADRVAAITAGYVRCDLDAAQATTLPPPANDAPVFYANAIEQAPGYGPSGYHGMYGTMFRRARWSRGN